MRDIDNRRLLIKAGGLALITGTYKMFSPDTVYAQRGAPYTPSKPESTNPPAGETPKPQPPTKYGLAAAIGLLAAEFTITAGSIGAMLYYTRKSK